MRFEKQARRLHRAFDKRNYLDDEWEELNETQRQEFLRLATHINEALKEAGGDEYQAAVALCRRQNKQVNAINVGWFRRRIEETNPQPDHHRPAGQEKEITA